MADATVAVLDDMTRERRRAASPTVTFLPEPEPEDLFCPIVSADDHVLEPADTFTSRVPRALRERVPFVVERDGYPHWVVDGAEWPFVLTNGAVGRVNREGDQAQRLQDYRPGVHDPHARIADMDLCGIWGTMCFPSVLWGFGGSRFFKLADREAALLSLKAYNDWVLEQWCATYPDRFMPWQLPWLADPQVAADEIRRNAERGARAVSFIENPEPLGLPSIYTDYWHPFFEACEETGTVINLHVGSSGLVSRPSTQSPQVVSASLFPVNGIIAAIDWVFAKIPVKYPELKIVLSEAGVSWVPMVIDRLRRSTRLGATAGWESSYPTPVEVFQRNFWFTSVEDPLAFDNLDLIGVDHVMVETDYPHGDSTWPRAQEMLRFEMPELDPKLVRKVCYGNACDLYRWTPPPEDMIARSTVGKRTGAQG